MLINNSNREFIDEKTFFLRFYSCHFFTFVTVFIIISVDTNVTQNNIFMIFCIICYAI